MATKFKLPTLTTTIIGRPRPTGVQETLPGLTVAPLSTPAQEADAPRAPTIQEQIRRQVDRELVPQKEFEPKEFFTLNTKVVLSRLVSAKITGENSARDVFKKYIEYISRNPDPFEDFVSHIYGSNEQTLSQIVDLLNADLQTEIPRLFPIKASLIKSEENFQTEIGFADFCRRYRMPLVASSTKDLMLFGVVNPSVAEGLRSALLREYPELGNPHIDFVILTPEEVQGLLPD